MIAAIIRWSIHNRLLVTLLTLLLTGWGAWSARHIPLDALPEDMIDIRRLHLRQALLALARHDHKILHLVSKELHAFILISYFIK